MSHTDTPCAHLLPTHHGSPQPSYSPKPLHAPPSHPNPRIDTLPAIVLTQQLLPCRPRPRLPSRGSPGPYSLHAALQVAVAPKAAVAALKIPNTASPCLLDKPPEQASATLAAAALLRHPQVLPLFSSSLLPCLLLFSPTPTVVSHAAPSSCCTAPQCHAQAAYCTTAQASCYAASCPHYTSAPPPANTTR